MKINFKQIVVCILFTGISSFTFAQEKVTLENIDKIKSYLSQTNIEMKNDRPATIIVTKDSDRYIDPDTLNIKLTTNNNQKTVYRKKPIDAVLITGEKLEKIKKKVLSKQSVL